MEYENVEIGKEMPPIEAKPVKVLSFEEADVKDKEQKEIGKKLVLKVQHPDVPEMEISKVKFQKGDKLKESGLWLGKDTDGKIPYSSALAHLLRHYSCQKIPDLKDKVLQTTSDSNGFCIAKAY